MYSVENNKLNAYTGSSAELVLPEGIRTIGSHAFQNHHELKRVVLSADVKTIGDFAFSGCDQLEEVVFNPGLKRLGEGCFEGCTHLRDVNLPASLASIRSGAFRNCSALEEAALPAGLRRCVDAETFSGCRALRSVTVPTGVEQIRFRAFCDCEQLAQLRFENPLVQVEDGAFAGCSCLDSETRSFIESRAFSRVILNVRSSTPGPAGRLSNFTPRSFLFDGVACGSIEGVLQSFKCPDPTRQTGICALSGNQARSAGRAYEWREGQTLYWQGEAYPRLSTSYQALLDRLYDAVYAQDAAFRADLAAVRGHRLEHSLGRDDPAQTILTRREFVQRLERLSLRPYEDG